MPTVDAPDSVYVHVPFCTRKCPYCAFTCKDDYDAPEVDLYMKSIEVEARRRAVSVRPKVRTLYFGGGTPSALGARGLKELHESLARVFDFGGMIEFTIEFNPEHVDASLAEAAFSAGSRRASLGVQSFSPLQLKRLGREHAPEDVAVAFGAFRSAGIESINVDLMYGLPLQTKNDFVDDVKRALDLGATHLSLYGLEFEEGTPFGAAKKRGRLAPADDGTSAEMFHNARTVAAAYGLGWYETSNFALEGFESLHNRTYWQNRPYVGLGPGAYGRVGALRYRNIGDTRSWSRELSEGRDPHAESDVLTPRDDVAETLVAGLRTRVGVDRAILSAEGSTPKLREAAASFVADGFAVETEGSYRLTTSGMLVLDAILPKLIETLPVSKS